MDSYSLKVRGQKSVTGGAGLYVVLVCIIGFLWASSIEWADAQTQPQSQAVSAKPVTRSSGRPSSMEIKQNALAQQQAILQGRLREVRRCITDASLPQVLRDPEGNMNRVPQTDLVDCTRKLSQLERQLKSLARQAAQLAQDAQFEGMELQGKVEGKKTQARLKGKSGL